MGNGDLFFSPPRLGMILSFVGMILRNVRMKKRFHRIGPAIVRMKKRFVRMILAIVRMKKRFVRMRKRSHRIILFREKIGENFEKIAEIFSDLWEITRRAG